MTKRRIRRLLIIAGMVGGIKILRDLTMARNRARCPEIVDGMTAAPPVRAVGR